MNLKEQQYVCTLAKCQTISRAAEELYISPSALSVYISNLEKYLGVKLFVRTGKSFVLTSLGSEYVKRAEKMLEMKTEFEELVRQELRTGHPPIRVGIQQRRAIYIVPETMKLFMEEYPDVEVIFRDGNQVDLITYFQEGSVDFVVTIYRGEFPDECHEEIAREQVLVALPEHHPANRYAYQVEQEKYPHLDMKYLDGETFVLPFANQSMRNTANRILEQTRIRPGRILETSCFDTIMNMVELGIGVGFNRLGYVKDMERYQGVRYYQIGADSFYSNLVLLYRKGRIFSDCEKRLIDILMENIRKRY